ncbi:sorbosone dehydrogenase family protein [Ammoniphilus sp. CFH 90114]|uniref:PQQ-dependent sugar dehydrogenase n=1 Tax=Ammoniphilus sp. CFH 90114 TaxID=2493665 RepID=UPI00100E0BCB|nr:PQQ-dependent sugar dehydrogenase [Ammoniphilus sp. CFH 90114]RXT03819.1 PQQ-dependent sugar dehydrogenase [Ammoniphilus sp. CFH 90114]
MKLVRLFFMAMILFIVTACSENITEDDPKPELFPYVVETVAERLDVPWEMDVAADGRIFFTERPGLVRVIVDGVLHKEPVIRMDEPFRSGGEGGLLGLVLDPQFEENGYIYVYHTYEVNGEIQNRVLRLKENNNKASIDRVIIDGLPGAQNHNGGRIKMGPDGYLYITSGDRYEPELAQEKQSLGGKILRIGLDGSIPEDNPFPGSPVYSLGHRNAQGLAWHPDTMQLYASEHGQSAHDEINKIEPGGNYGWPIIEGDETLSQQPELKSPFIHSGTETWAPSGMTFITEGPWRGQLLVANLRGNQVLKLSLGSDGLEVEEIESLLQEWGRIRNVYEGPDQSIYIMTNNRDGRGKPEEADDKIYRLRPKD